MNKIFLVIKREFLSRVKKKSFLIATILVPLIFPALIGGMVVLAVQNQKNKQQETIQVLNESKDILSFEDDDRYAYKLIEGDLDSVKREFSQSSDFGLIYIPQITLEEPEGIVFYSKTSPGLSMLGQMERKFARQIRDLKLKRSGLTQAQLDSLQTTVNIESLSMDEAGQEKRSSAELSSGIGYIMGLMIYIFLFAYGAQVMNGVIEEKSSKIVEVILSSVRPIQLMIGKVVGVAAVGIFQFLIWMLLITLFWIIAGVIFGIPMSMEAADMAQNAQQSDVMNNDQIQRLIETVYAVPWLKVSFMFLFYFIFGYVFYGALFAAVGSAVQTANDAQQFMIPIMMPIIIGLMGLFLFVFEDPHGPASFWLSIIPFTSPIVMMGRVGFGPAGWEIILSMVLLIGGCLFTLWLAGRIYRVGILMHGAKVNYKVLAKWIMMKN